MSGGSHCGAQHISRVVTQRLYGLKLKGICFVCFLFIQRLLHLIDLHQEKQIKTQNCLRRSRCRAVEGAGGISMLANVNSLLASELTEGCFLLGLAWWVEWR